MYDEQPGVADPTMERLVEEKVDMFWKGLENVALKRGQVRLRNFHLGETVILIHLRTLQDFRHIFKEGPKEGMAWNHNI
jgi:hypothetical protein